MFDICYNTTDGESYLAWLSYSRERAQEIVDRLNSDREYRETECRRHGMFNTHNITTFYVDEEEDTRDWR